MRGKEAFVWLCFVLIILAAPWPASAGINLKPEKACQVLRSLGLKTGPYQLQGKDYLCVAGKELAARKLPNVLHYLVVGDKRTVQELRLELSVDAPRRQGAAKNLLAKAALLLAGELGWKEPPDGLEEAVRRGSEGRWKNGEVILTLVKHPVPDPPRGYKLILTAH